MTGKRGSGVSLALQQASSAGKKREEIRKKIIHTYHPFFDLRREKGGRKRGLYGGGK